MSNDGVVTPAPGLTTFQQSDQNGKARPGLFLQLPTEKSIVIEKIIPELLFRLVFRAALSRDLSSTERSFRPQGEHMQVAASHSFKHRYRKSLFRHGALLVNAKMKL